MAVPKDIKDDEKVVIKMQPKVEKKEETRDSKKEEPRLVLRKVVPQPPARKHGLEIFKSLERTRSIKQRVVWFGGKAKRALGNERVQLFVMVAVLALIVSIAGRGVTGAVIGTEELTTLESCKVNLTAAYSQIQTLQSSSDSLKTLNNQLSDQVRSYADTIKTRDTEIGICQSSRTSAETNLTKAQSDLAIAKVDADRAMANASSLQSNYDVLAQNYANRYCCQLRALGFNYNTYSIADNNVVCTPSGGKAINCTA